MGSFDWVCLGPAKADPFRSKSPQTRPAVGSHPERTNSALTTANERRLEPNRKTNVLEGKRPVLEITMSRGMPSMTALLGLLAIAGYQNRDKLAEMLREHGANNPNPNAGTA